MGDIFQPQIIGPMVGGIIAVCAIVGSMILRYRKMELDAQQKLSSSSDETQRALLAELQRLHNRLARLEQQQADTLGMPNATRTPESY